MRKTNLILMSLAATLAVSATALTSASMTAAPALAQEAQKQQKRVALVIGISKYNKLSSLTNPSKDAKAIAAQLRKNGFEVSEHHDLKRADLLDALEEFQEKAEGAKLAVVYYAGHGMEVDGKDIIAPADMNISCEPKKAKRAVKLQRLFEAASTAENQIVLLDSCRNDPFPDCKTRSAREGTGFRGLSRITNDKGSMLIANATLSGSLAADGKPGEHSPFAKALLNQFETRKNVYFRDMLDQVAKEVRKLTNGQQIPEITARGGSPGLCLSTKDCVQLASLPQDQAAIQQPNQNQQSQVDKPQKSKEYAPGDVFKDCENCPQMTVIPPGKFFMGSPVSELGRRRAEGPQHEVTIKKALAVSTFEITFDQWEACLLDGGCKNHKPDDSGWGKGKRPVHKISWDDAKAYIEWLREKTGKRYRLLTEAEWEYAARAGTKTAFVTGQHIKSDQANFDGTHDDQQGARGKYRGKTIEVGTFKPNPFGLHDMHGNVAEWVEDCWNKTHHGAPGDGSPRGGDCNRRIIKGGAWYFEPSYARIAARISYPKNKRLNVIGLRVARELE